LRASILAAAVAVLVGCELPVATGTCQGPQTYAVGDAVENVAFVDDCDGPHGLSGDVYAFTLAAHTGVTIEMDPSGFEAAFEVYQGAYGGAVTPAKIAEGEGSGLIGARVFLPPGDYFILSGSANRERGNYTLSTSLVGLVDCDYAGYTVRSADVTGVVTTSDCSAAPPNRQDIYELLLPAGALLKARVSADRPGFLLIRTGSASSDDLAAKSFGPGSLDSLSYTTTSAGWYRVHVGSNPVGTGPMNYTLNVR
jgi:hypothetical protein